MKSLALHRFFLRILLGLNGVDAGTTIAMVQMGLAEEMNPIMRAALGVHPYFFLAVKLLLIDYLVVKLSHGGAHWVARLAAAVATLFYLLLVVGTIYSIIILSRG